MVAVARKPKNLVAAFRVREASFPIAKDATVSSGLEGLETTGL